MPLWLGLEESGAALAKSMTVSRSFHHDPFLLHKNKTADLSVTKLGGQDMNTRLKVAFTPSIMELTKVFEIPPKC